MSILKFCKRFFALAALLALAGLGRFPMHAAPSDVRRDAVVEAVEKAMPSVVNIGTKTRREQLSYQYEWRRNAWTPFAKALPPQESAGSGVIIDEAGYVLTNVHVAEGADEIWVNVDGRIYRADPIVGLRQTDVALLKIRAKPEEKFRAARFAPDDDLLLGETVLALGNPFGLGGSVSRGILSSKSRRPEAKEAEELDVPDWLQTDASINPGNSGGPLVNLRGEVIGINVAVLKQAHGIGFAIPIKRVSDALAEMFTPEALKQLWFGARLKPGSHPLRVTDVEPESPAAKAGLKAGDAILTLDGKPVQSFMEFSAALIDGEKERTYKVQIERGGNRSALSLRLAPESSFFNADLVLKRTGMRLQELTPELADTLGLSYYGGLVISEVARRSPAAEARLEPRQVLQSVDGRPLHDVRDLARLINGRKAGEKLQLAITAEQAFGPFMRRVVRKAELTLR